MKDVENLQERVSHLTLEKGNLRTEIDDCMQLLAHERSQGSDNILKTESLQKELEVLVDSNKLLHAEIATLRKRLEDGHSKANATQQETSDRFTAELKSRADLLAKETDKTKALNAMITKLKEAEGTARLDFDRAKKENQGLNTKYYNQTAEHSKAFAVCCYHDKDTKYISD